MRSYRFLLLLTLLPSTVLAQSTPQQFDLQCTGKLFFGERKEISNKNNWSQVSVTYKIDFGEHRWCTGECKETFPLKSVNDKFIVLDHEKEEDLSYDKDVFINRETGALIDRIRIPPSLMLITADCTRKPFSGFPALKF